MSPEDAAPEPVTWVGNRNFIVPPGIVPVHRVSPLPRRKHTVCRPRPEGEPVDRAGGREWFSDRLCSDTKPRDLGAFCGSSIAVHAGSLIGLLVVLVGEPVSTTPERASEPLRMPMFVAVMGGDGGAARAASPRPMTAAAPRPPATPPANTRASEATRQPPVPAVEPVPSPTAPEEAADADQNQDADRAETETAQSAIAAATEGLARGAEGDGINGGGSGSGRSGVGGGASGVGMSPGPYRLGQGIEPPRKIKDVRPIYPAGALAMHALGTVVIEAVVGADGKVHRANVVQSIPDLDQAALDAVRQWEFAPARLNGVAVSVIVTILVKFSLY